MRNNRPLISFSFDDFPRSALLIGGALLEKYHIAGTYYASLGLMGKTAPTGEIFRRADLAILSARGHELGCHTYDHRHAYDTPSDDFERSIIQNRRALEQVTREARFETMSFPISCPRPSTKRRCAEHFTACRGGGQTFNSGVVDLNHLSAFFIEQSRDDFSAINKVISATCRAGGWLIFATHDVCEDPTPYGCTPELFDLIVRSTIESSAEILPVSQALAAIGVDTFNQGKRNGQSHAGCESAAR